MSYSSVVESYYTAPPAPPPQEEEPVQSAPAPVQSYGSVVGEYYASAPVETPAPSSTPVADTGALTQGTVSQSPPPPPAATPVLGGVEAAAGAVTNALVGAGDFIGDRIEQVGGPELRQNLSGVAPDLRAVQEAQGPVNKILTVADTWDRPQQWVQQAVGDQAVTQPETAPYSLTTREGLQQAASEFGNQLADYAQHPEHALQAIGQDMAESDVAVFGDAPLIGGGEQGFNDWVQAHPEAAREAGGDGEALYQMWLSDIGYTWEEGGLAGIGRGLVQQSLQDPTLIPSLGAGAITKLASGAANAGKVGTARGMLTSPTAINTVLGGPEELLLDTGASLLSKAARNVPGLRSVFTPSAETQRTIETQAVDEITQGVATGRGEHQRLTASSPNRTITNPGTSASLGTLGGARRAPAPATPPTPPSTPTVPSRSSPVAPPQTLYGRRSTSSNNRSNGRVTPPAITWNFDPAQRVWTANGNLPSPADLKAEYQRQLDLHPRTLQGYDEAEILGRMLTDPAYKQAVQGRAALTQGVVDPTSRHKTPYMLNDIPKARMAQGGSTPQQNMAGSRWRAFASERIKRYGEEEITYQMRLLQNEKYRGIRGNTQPLAIWWDNRRQATLDAIRQSGWTGPVDLGLRHKMDPATGTYVLDPKRPLTLNTGAPGTPLKLEDFEPNITLWQALQSSANAQGNPPQFRITTPPPQPPSGAAAPLAVQTAPLTTPPTVAQAPVQNLVQQGAQQTATPPAATPDEFDNLPGIADGWMPALRMDAGGRTLFRTITEEQDDVWHFLDLLHGRQADVNGDLPKLTAKYEKHWKTLYGNDPDFSKLTPQEADLFAANIAHKAWYDSLPPLKKKQMGPGSGIAQISSDVASFRSAVGLHNWATFARQVAVQHVGNVASLAMTKPSAITKMFNPRTLAAYVKAAARSRKSLTGPNNRVQSASMQSLERMGLPVNSMISADIAKTLAGGSQRGIKSPLLSSIKRIVAPDVLRDIVSIPDQMLRDAVMATDFFPQVRSLQRNFGKTSAATAQNWVRAKGLQIPPGQVTKAVNDAFRAYYSTGQRVSEITATQLEAALKTAFQNSPNQDIVGAFANRIARDYKTQLNTIHQQAAREVRKIGFSWDYTKADDALRHFFLYHYWTSRAGGLYVKAMLANPWLAGSFARLAQQLHEEAQSLEYPLWMEGYSRLLASPIGTILFANPTSMFSAMFFFAEWQYGMEPEKIGSDLTDIGRARGLIPAVISPLVDGPLWGAGVYGGEDAARLIMDPTGFEKIWRETARIFNLARLNNHLPKGMLSDAAGNPQLLPERPITGMWARMMSALGSVVRDDPQPIPDLYASQSANEQAALLTLIMEEHPDWVADPIYGENKITREFVNITTSVEQGTGAPPLWQEAQLRALEQQVRGPEFSQLPTGIQGVVGAMLRNVSPMQIQSRSELSQTLRSTPVTVPGREPMTLPGMGDEYDVYDLGGAIYDTPEQTRFGTLEEDWWGDPALNDARKRMIRIGDDGGSPDGEIINGVSYTQEQIMAMTDDRRWKLAREALAEDGFTQADLDAAKEQQRVMEELNPELAAYQGYKDAINNAPDRRLFIDDLYDRDPAFRRMMDRSGKEHQSDEWYDSAAEWPETFRGTMGERTSLYDPLSPLPEGTLSEGQLAMGRGETREAWEEGASTFMRDRERQVNEAILAQRLLDAEYPGYGFRVGAGNLPYEVWTHMKGVWQGADIDTSYITKTDHYGSAYINWRAANVGTLEDVSLQAYLDTILTDDGSNKFADGQQPSDPALADAAAQAEFDLNAPLDYSLLDQEFGIANAPAQASGAQIVIPDVDLDLRQSPGGKSITRLSRNLALRVIRVEGEWAYVSAPGGFEGYVPTQYLKKAA